MSGDGKRDSPNRLFPPADRDDRREDDRREDAPLSDGPKSASNKTGETTPDETSGASLPIPRSVLDQAASPAFAGLRKRLRKREDGPPPIGPRPSLPEPAPPVPERDPAPEKTTADARTPHAPRPVTPDPAPPPDPSVTPVQPVRGRLRRIYTATELSASGTQTIGAPSVTGAGPRAPSAPSAPAPDEAPETGMPTAEPAAEAPSDPVVHAVRQAREESPSGPASEQAETEPSVSDETGGAEPPETAETDRPAPDGDDPDAETSRAGEHSDAETDDIGGDVVPPPPSEMPAKRAAPVLEAPHTDGATSDVEMATPPGWPGIDAYELPMPEPRPQGLLERIWAGLTGSGSPPLPVDPTRKENAPAFEHVEDIEDRPRADAPAPDGSLVARRDADDASTDLVGPRRPGSPVFAPAPSPTGPAPSHLSDMTWFQAAAALIAVVTGIRIFVIATSGLNLDPDEAQYWSWSRDLAFGYFSKPPVLPWIIAATTSVCGSGEACVRIGSPLIYAATSLMLFVTARSMFDARTGFLVSATFVTLPGIWFSATLISTDVPLLFFWTVGLFALWRLSSSFHPGWAVLLGLAVGLGMMSKYAMLYFIIGTSLLVVLDRQVRIALLHGRGLIVLAIAGLVVLPNILWNQSNGFATVSHTAANANWGDDRFNVENLLKFVGDQFGIFGPILFAVLLWRLGTLGKTITSVENRRALIYLLCFAVPPLAIITVQSFISRAHANWAATSYVAATILVVVWLSQTRARWLIAASFLLHLMAGMGIYALMLSADLSESLGRGNDLKRLRGWDEIGEEVRWRAVAGNDDRLFSTVLSDERRVFAELLYYGSSLVPLTMWEDDGVPEDHFELNNPLTPDFADHVLYVTRRANAAGVLQHFDTVTPLGELITEVGGGRLRTFAFYALEGFNPPFPVRPGKAAMREREIDRARPADNRDPAPLERPDETGGGLTVIKDPAIDDDAPAWMQPDNLAPQRPVKRPSDDDDGPDRERPNSN